MLHRAWGSTRTSQEAGRARQRPRPELLGGFPWKGWHGSVNSSGPVAPGYRGCPSRLLPVLVFRMGERDWVLRTGLGGGSGIGSRSREDEQLGPWNSGRSQLRAWTAGRGGLASMPGQRRVSPPCVIHRCSGAPITFQGHAVEYAQALFADQSPPASRVAPYCLVVGLCGAFLLVHRILTPHLQAQRQQSIVSLYASRWLCRVAWLCLASVLMLGVQMHTLGT